jgi:membrane protein DedA with SNARE-associated domain
MFAHFTHLVSQASAWAYVVIFALAALDAILPLVPSETAVITAGVLAAGNDLNLALVLGCAALGAFVGDNATYLLGRRFGDRAMNRLSRSENGAKRVEWARGLLRNHSGELIVAGRFVPGGRTAVSLTAGSTKLAWPRFVRLDVIAAVVWASYASLLGYFGGRAFEHSAWKGLVVALGTAVAVTALVQGVRALHKRRRSRRR